MRPWVRKTIALMLVVAAWCSAVAVATAVAVREPVVVAESPVVALSRARTECRLIGVDRAGETRRLRVVDLHAAALTCLLDRMGAPEYVMPRIAGTWPVDGRFVVTWGPVSASWFRWSDGAVDQGLDVTITLLV